jgi:hypothetical protein
MGPWELLVPGPQAITRTPQGEGMLAVGGYVEEPSEVCTDLP